MQTVLDETIAILDAAGESALTFRALATRLGGGVGSIYWYVASRDELLARATDEVMGRVLVETEKLATGPNPIANLQALSVALFDAFVARPWFGQFMLRDTSMQPNSMLMFDRLGQQTMRLDLSPKQRFNAVMSIVSYIVGVAIDVAQPAPQEFLDSGLEPSAFLEMYANRWRALDSETHPFAHDIADEFAVHDDKEVFRAGLDLLLSGLQIQAAPDNISGPRRPRSDP